VGPKKKTIVGLLVLNQNIAVQYTVYTVQVCFIYLGYSMETWENMPIYRICHFVSVNILEFYCIKN
jgi:hypothetical protein